MKRYIAVAAALIVIFVVLLGTNMKIRSGNSRVPFSLPNFFSPSLSLPSVEHVPVANAAWATFQNYLSALKDHDLAKVKALSHHLSPACSDPARTEECYGLMDSAYFFASSFKQSDFVNVAYDDRQVVMSTNYLMLEGADEPIKTVLYFTTTAKTDPKVLGIRFCIGEESERDECVETDPSKRDNDQDGWWDGVEALF